MTLPPPRSTLFPYTTLFRSTIRDPAIFRVTNGAASAILGGPGLPHRAGSCDVEARRIPSRHRDAPPIVPEKSGPDRKSTRLNSSHVEISYAVFCLKKKKKKT